MHTLQLEEQTILSSTATTEMKNLAKVIHLTTDLAKKLNTL